MDPQTKVKKPVVIKDNFVEQGSEMIKYAASSAASVPNDIVKEALAQVGFTSRKPLSGEINLRAKTHITNQEKQPSVQESNQARKEQNVSRQFQSAKREFQAVNEREIAEKRREVEQLKAQLSAEIKKLQVKTSELSSDVKKMTVESNIAKPDKYHENLLLWLIKEVQKLGRKVTESRMWLQVAYQKKQKKGFWAMAKKHGNNFLMSGERVPAGGVG